MAAVRVPTSKGAQSRAPSTAPQEGAVAQKHKPKTERMCFLQCSPASTFPCIGALRGSGSLTPLLPG
ncbi:hypothetical protein ILYODFUR_007274 [Ilyodon furcidens]|uniref:Uncharacterized protein n=1 Tax=Ilyodon furcidens TaxID=33524 RepID=A0ABV0TGP7_9TELE